MPTQRHPILVWQDAAGGHTACMVEDSHGVAAVSDSPADAAEQIRDYLQWKLKDRGYLSEPDFLEPELCWVKVEVRPEYRVGERIFACREPVALRVPCVTGHDSNGMLLCAMPTLGIRFSYSDSDSFKGLAAHYVQANLREMTPQALARCLPPRDAILKDVIVRVPPEMSFEPRRKELPEAVVAIADPVTSRLAHGRIARPWERDDLVAELANLVRNERACVLIVGDSGCGKSAILTEAARQVERSGEAELSPEDKVIAESFGATEEGEPEKLKPPGRRRFWLTNASRLISGMKYLGQWQERLEQIIAELARFDGVLCIENALDLVRTGGQTPSDGLAAFLVPYMLSGEVRIIAEATPAELDACRRRLPSFAGAFRIVTVANLTRAQSLNVLRRVTETLSQNRHIDVHAQVVDQTYRLFARFMPYQSFPGKAVGFLGSLYDKAAAAKSRSVNSAAALTKFVGMTGLPEKLLRDDLPLPREQVVAALQASVVGQDHACRAAARVITAFKAGVNDPERPIGVLLFCGPTGVGKTELARAMSRFMFGQGDDADRLVRLDMSEYAGAGAAERLLGSEHGGPSELVKRLRRQPFCVLLLDEIEKAAPEVFDLLLGVFDEGRLTDSFGRLTTFRSSLIIMTSNLGAQAAEPIGLLRKAAVSYESEAMAFFRPEFFNRIDAVVAFAPLSGETIRAITEKELLQVASREGIARMNLKLKWTPGLVNHLAQAGFDARYGARPLQRAIETIVVAPLARYLTANPSIKNTTVVLDFDGQQMHIELQ